VQILAVLLLVAATPQFEHQDECIDPRRESQGWRVLTGNVRAIEPDGELRLANVVESYRHLPPRVVRFATVEPSLPAAKPFLESLIGKSVTVWVNDREMAKDHVIGVVYIGQEEDINRALLSRGLGRYVKPPAYSLSDYTDCLHRIAEREARAHHRGLWAKDKEVP
jgi:hypothetical protein